MNKHIVIGVFSLFIAGVLLTLALFSYQTKNELVVLTQKFIARTRETNIFIKWFEERAKDKATESDFADWKTYRNDKYGVEFRYPSELELSEAGPTGPNGEYYTVGLVKGDTIVNIILKQPMSQEDLATACVVGAENELKTFSTVAGSVRICTGEHNGVVFLGTHMPAYQKGYAHEVNVSGDATRKAYYLKLFEQILSTFRFIPLERP